ncbi:MAG: hypothetical protein QG650_154 [Patescibacteria group bacterium]|jgi:hypothetical protein|nr:hypothetical protein [Patescibacteria group bacterium]
MIEERLQHAASLLRDIREAIDEIVDDSRALAEFIHNVTE